jgi:TonB-dependent SusC/RagA subfamily outer membrane receptor
MRILAVVAGLAVVLGCSSRQADQGETKPKPTAPPPAQPNTVNTVDEQARSDARTLEQILGGRISGVQVTPGHGGGIIVRFSGAQSFYSGGEPLFVIDGSPTSVTGGELSWLNPRDVESITAVKGPDAAMYGVRGANGVIVIKTKGSH